MIESGCMSAPTFCLFGRRGGGGGISRESSSVLLVLSMVAIMFVLAGLGESESVTREERKAVRARVLTPHHNTSQ